MKKIYPPEGFPAALYPFWTPTSVVKMARTHTNKHWAVFDSMYSIGVTISDGDKLAVFTECRGAFWAPCDHCVPKTLPNREIEVTE